MTKHLIWAMTALLLLWSATAAPLESTYGYSFNSHFNDKHGLLNYTANGATLNTTSYPVYGTSGNGTNASANFLSASNTYAYTPNDLLTSATNWSICTWMLIRNNGGGWPMVLMGDGTASDRGFELNFDGSGYLTFNWATGAAGSWHCAIWSTTVFSSYNSWQHLCVVHATPNTTKLYINGAENTTNTVGSCNDGLAIRNPSGSTNTTLGRWNAAGYITNYDLNGNLDELHIYTSALSAAQVASMYARNLTEEVTIAAPTWNAPTNGTANNTQITVNFTCEAGTTAFLWMTNTSTTWQLLDNASTSTATTNVNDSKAYNFTAACYNAAYGLLSSNSTINEWTYDTNAPTISLAAGNEFTTNNVTIGDRWDDELNLSISLTDTIDLYAAEITATYTENGTVYGTYTNETLSGTSATITTTFNTTTWPGGLYTIALDATDSHTATAIDAYEATTEKETLLYRTTEGNNINITAQGAATATTTKSEDHYSFSFTYADKTPTKKTFDLTADTTIHYRPDSPYTAHFVITKGKPSDGGNWVDFEGTGGEPTVKKISDTHWTITFDSLGDATFQSIGGLNHATASYTWEYLKYNDTQEITEYDPTIEFTVANNNWLDDLNASVYFRNATREMTCAENATHWNCGYVTNSTTFANEEWNITTITLTRPSGIGTTETTNSSYNVSRGQTNTDTRIRFYGDMSGNEYTDTSCSIDGTAMSNSRNGYFNLKGGNKAITCEADNDGNYTAYSGTITINATIASNKSVSTNNISINLTEPSLYLNFTTNQSNLGSIGWNGEDGRAHLPFNTSSSGYSDATFLLYAAMGTYPNGETVTVWFGNTTNLTRTQLYQFTVDTDENVNETLYPFDYELDYTMWFRVKNTDLQDVLGATITLDYCRDNNCTETTNESTEFVTVGQLVTDAAIGDGRLGIPVYMPSNATVYITVRADGYKTMRLPPVRVGDFNNDYATGIYLTPETLSFNYETMGVYPERTSYRKETSISVDIIYFGNKTLYFNTTQYGTPTRLNISGNGGRFILTNGSHYTTGNNISLNIWERQGDTYYLINFASINITYVGLTPDAPDAVAPLGNITSTGGYKKTLAAIMLLIVIVASSLVGAKLTMQDGADTGFYIFNGAMLFGGIIYPPLLIASIFTFLNIAAKLLLGPSRD